jgi:hypothetical protein
MASSPLSRRGFLKMSSLSAAGLFAPRFWPDGDRLETGQAGVEAGSYNLGRTIQSMHYYDRPTLSAEQLGYYNTDAVVKVYDKRIGDPEPANNPFWLRTDEGWIHSSFVQPVRDQVNIPENRLPAPSFLAEVTVPYTPAYIYKKGALKQVYRFYYGTTHWIVGIDRDSAGTIWYQTQDDLEEVNYLVHGAAMRRITPEEIAPLSPGIAGKRIEINLTAQRLTAFEGNRIVRTARVSTGYGKGATPAGEYYVERKAPYSHMSASEFGGNGFDLPGVPWCSFIFWNGISIHGTYWHNNFGAPMSHGCINLTPETAKWIYRWSDPVVPFEKNYLKEQGTPVLVF